VAEAMNAIYVFTHDHDHESENELTLQYLGIRLFNVAGASVKLALSGYYQNAFHIELSLTELLNKVDLEIGKANEDKESGVAGAEGRLAQAENRHAELWARH
jgi:hypothetical protein